MPVHFCNYTKPRVCCTPLPGEFVLRKHGAEITRRRAYGQREHFEKFTPRDERKLSRIFLATVDITRPRCATVHWGRGRTHAVHAPVQPFPQGKRMCGEEAGGMRLQGSIFCGAVPDRYAKLFISRICAPPGQHMWGALGLMFGASLFCAVLRPVLQFCAFVASVSSALKSLLHCGGQRSLW